MRRTITKRSPSGSADDAPDTSYVDLLEPHSLDRRIPLREQIYELVRRLIVSGQLRPGEPINEVAIADRLGVSRTPVREAVKRLSDERLIEVFAQSGTFVAHISREEIEEAYIIRTALELQSVARAAPQMTSIHADNLREIVVRHELLLSRGRYADAIKVDDQFHRYIAEITGMKMLWRAVDISKAQMDRGRLLVLPEPGQGALTIAQHNAVLDALIAKDAAKATEAMRDHLTLSLENTLRLAVWR